MITEKNTILKITAGKPQDGVHVEVVSEKRIQTCNWHITNEEGNVLSKGCKKENGNRISFGTQFDAGMWSIANPILYTLEVEVVFEDNSEELISDRFGF